MNKNQYILKNKYLINWKSRILQDMKNINKFIDFNLKNKKTLIGYGAPTKASLILKILKLIKENLN